MLECLYPRKKIICQLICYLQIFNLVCHMPILQLIFEYFKNQADPKEAIEKACPNAGPAASKIKSYKQKICHFQSFNMMCHMPKLQVICNPSKYREDAKEDTENASPNL